MVIVTLHFKPCLHTYGILQKSHFRNFVREPRVLGVQNQLIECYLHRVVVNNLLYKLRKLCEMDLSIGMFDYLQALIQ